MTEDDATEDSTSEQLPAGDFSSWIVEVRGALRGRNGTDVPCGTCTACCTSSQFVHIEPDEAETLAHIPDALLFPAPGLPRGHVLLGYDERGHCPLLVEGRCSIYAHRPRTCRTYDCRVFPAAGVTVEEHDKARIAERAARWEFSYPTSTDRVEHDAVRRAAAFLREHAEALPDGVVPTTATRLAVLAVEVHDLFLHRDAVTGRTTPAEPDPSTVGAALLRRREARRAG